MSRLEGREAIRKRPGMYVGGNDSKALMHILWEVIDNSVDEALAGYGKKIVITLHSDDRIEVLDYGRGIPSEKNSEGFYGLSTAFYPHGGGKFEEGAYETSGGLNGVGLAAVAALSSRCEGEVYRDGKKYTIQFNRGVQGFWEGEHFTPADEEIRIEKDSRADNEKNNRPSGTSVSFTPDYDIFDSGEDDAPRAEMDIEKILRRADRTTYLIPGLKIIVDDRKFTHHVHEFISERGMQELVEKQVSKEPVGHKFSYQGATSFTSSRKEKTLDLEVYAQWENSNKGSITSFVNIIETSEGGTHVNGLQRALLEAVSNIAETKKIKKARDPEIEAVDVLEGLHAAISIKLRDPGYSAQTKEKLTEAAVTNAVRKIVLEGLTQWFNARGNNESTVAIVEKIMSTARARHARDAKFDISEVRAETAKEAVLSSSPGKLIDCEFPGHPLSTLNTVEGDSAVGTMERMRDSRYQAFFPLKGKPLNVIDLSPEQLYLPPQINKPAKQLTPTEKRRNALRNKLLDNGHVLLQNKELDDFVKTVGAGFGSEFDIEKMRYHDILLSADADPDGAHINTLLIGFIWRYMRPIITHGRLYKSLPPLFVIKVGNEAEPEMHYALTSRERDQILNKLRAEQKRIIHVGRRKGLGEMSEEETYMHLLNRETRKLHRVTIGDAKEADRIIQLTLGSDALLRKEWIKLPDVIQRVKGAEEEMLEIISSSDK